MTEKRPHVIVVGSANLDLVVDVARIPKVGETLLGEAVGRFPGGKGLNQALAAARSGVACEFRAVVGADEAGRILQDVATEAGVTGTMRISADLPTGVAHIFALPDSDNAIVVAAGANLALAEEDVRSGWADGTVLLAQLEVPFDTIVAALHAARDAGALTVLNAAPAHSRTLEVLDLVDVLVVNETEAEELGGIDALSAGGDLTIVLTRGAAGMSAYRGGGEPLHVDAFRIDAVDTTGAGDAFCGVFAGALAEGRPLGEALRRGAAAGAIVASHMGASTPALTRAAIDEMVAG